MKQLAAVAAAFVLCPAVFSGQARKGSSPTEVAREFFAAQADGRWLDAARLLDLAAFEGHRRFAIQTASRDTSVGARTPEQIMAEQPDMPRAVAEYFAKQIGQLTDRDALSMTFAHTSSVDTLAALPVDQAAARWLEARDARWQLERSQARLGPECVRYPTPPTIKPPAKEVLAPAVGAATVPGASDSVTYVLFRDPIQSPSMRRSEERKVAGMPPGVITLTRVNGEWRILPLHDLGFAGGTRSYASVACTTVEKRPQK